MGRPVINISGNKYGKLTATNEYVIKNQKRTYWYFDCDCGNKNVLINKNNVLKGTTQSCGCAQQDWSITHGKSQHAIYSNWIGIMGRCLNIKDKSYKHYGGRGITICEQWMDITNFIEWSENNGYKKGLHIDRIDNDGNYCPENCQWITNAENQAIGKKRMQSNNNSGYVGVCYDESRNKWRATIRKNKKWIQIGRYDNINDAVEARINKEMELFGEQKTNLDIMIEDL